MNNNFNLNLQNILLDFNLNFYLTEQKFDWIDRVNIITQNRQVFRSNIFNNIIAKINTINPPGILLFNREDLEKLGLKTYGWKELNKRLAIFKFNFTQFNELQYLFISFFSQKEYNRNKDGIKKLFFQYIQNKNDGLYLPLDKNIGIAFIDINMSDNIIKHQLIHFIQDVSYQGLYTIYQKYLNDQSYKFTPIQILAYKNELNTFNLIDQTLTQAIFNKKELIVYINSICYYFQNQQITKDRAIQIVKNIFNFKKKCNNIEQLKTYVKNIPELKKLDHILYVILILCAVYQQHKTIILRIISNYLKDI